MSGQHCSFLFDARPATDFWAACFRRDTLRLEPAWSPPLRRFGRHEVVHMKDLLDVSALPHGSDGRRIGFLLFATR